MLRSENGYRVQAVDRAAKTPSFGLVVVFMNSISVRSTVGGSQAVASIAIGPSVEMLALDVLVLPM